MEMAECGELRPNDAAASSDEPPQKKGKLNAVLQHMPSIKSMTGGTSKKFKMTASPSKGSMEGILD
jgi:hypothetical protein